ncbi:hypothetical protein AAZV13_20G183300 [Glycine max]
MPLANKIRTKLASWKWKFFSFIGGVFLAKSVIYSMLAYNFHVYQWPKAILKTIDSWIKNFIWSGDIHTIRVGTIAWPTSCKSIEEGGLGLRSVSAINRAAMLKIGWCFVSLEIP